MERREFLGIMAAGVGAAALGGAVQATAESKLDAVPSPSAGKPEPKMSPEAQLVGYCGRFCGRCPMSAFNVGLGVNALKKVNDTIAVGKAVEMIGFPPIHDMAVHCCADFNKDVASFADITKIAFPLGCRTGCAPCDIPDCCKSKGYMTCAECDQTTKCKKLDKPIKEGANILANQKGIREMGLEKWAKMQCEEAISEKKAALHKALDEAF